MERNCIPRLKNLLKQFQILQECTRVILIQNFSEKTSFLSFFSEILHEIRGEIDEIFR